MDNYLVEVILPIFTPIALVALSQQGDHTPNQEEEGCRGEKVLANLMPFVLLDDHNDVVLLVPMAVISLAASTRPSIFDGG